MHPLYSVLEIRAIEHAARAQLRPGTLMQRAGLAAAKFAQALLAPLHGKGAANVLLLAGPGDNGGDALEMAAHLAQAGMTVSVCCMGQSEAVSQTANKTAAGTASIGRQQALQRAQNCALHFEEHAASAIKTGRWDLVVDGLFGIGLTRALDAETRQIVAMINQLRCPVLALDVPSGLDADSGAVLGADDDEDGMAVCASHTLTFIGDKPGLHTCDGRDHAGMVQIASLDIGPGLMPAATACLNDTSLFAHWLKPRRQNTHKGSFGDVVVIGGAHGMAGAPVLAARSALLCGAGRVHVAFIDGAPLFDDAHPELMFKRASDFDWKLDLKNAALVAGPGLGASAPARALLERVIGSDQALLLDADALNLIARHPELQTMLARRSAPAVLTPHPLEAARLLGVTASAVQADRLGAARKLAKQLQAIIVLKGSGSIIAAAGGMAVINPSGNPALATAGSGDVLSGVCGALLAQGWPQWEAALGAAWLHGLAADQLVAAGLGPIGICASELIPALRVALNRLAQRSIIL